MVPVNFEEVLNDSLFFLGAGASFDAGCKISSKMLEDLKINLTSELVKNNEIYLEIYKFIHASLLYQNSYNNIDDEFISLNIEDFVRIINIIIDRSKFVPYPVVGNWNEKIIGWENKTPDIFRKFREVIEKLLVENWLKFDEKEAETLLKPINEILSLDGNFQLNFFTLNYDLIFERILNKNQADIVLSDGFEINDWNGTFGKKLNYYKLHGSLNWYFDESMESIRKNANESDTIKPMIIFGNDNKMISFDPFLQLLNIFKEKLEEARLIIIIGYSFQDKYINNLIIQKLMNRKFNKKLIVVDPSIPTEKELINKIRKIQSAKNLDEIINFTKISADFIDIFQMKAKEFYSYIFENEGKNLIEKYNEIIDEDNVF